MGEDRLHIRCNRQLCEKLTEAIELFDDYHRKASLPLAQVLDGYLGLLQQIAEATDFFEPNDAGLTAVCKRIYEYCALVILSIGWLRQPPVSLSAAAGKFYSFHCCLSAWAHDSFLVVATLAQNPWRGKTTSAILSGTNNADIEEVDRYLAAEGQFILEHRLRILIQDGFLYHALNLARACAAHAQLGRAPIFFETTCLLLHKLALLNNIEVQVAQQPSLELLAGAVRNMAGYCPEVASLLAGMILKRVWAEGGSSSTGGTELAREVTTLWVETTWERCRRDPAAFSAALEEIYWETKDPAYLFYLADTTHRKIGTSVLSVLVSVCLHALTAPSVPVAQDIFQAAGIDSGNVAICCLLYQLMERDIRVQRVILLAIFFITPSVRSYFILKEAFTRKVTSMLPLRLDSFEHCDLVKCIRYFIPEDISPACEWKDVSKICIRYLHKSKVFRTEWRLPDGNVRTIRVHSRTWNPAGETPKLMRLQEMKGVCHRALERCKKGTELVSVVHEQQKLPEKENHKRKIAKDQNEMISQSGCQPMETFDPCGMLTTQESAPRSKKRIRLAVSSRDQTCQEQSLEAIVDEVSDADMAHLTMVMQGAKLPLDDALENITTMESYLQLDDSCEGIGNVYPTCNEDAKTTLEKIGVASPSFTVCPVTGTESLENEVVLESQERMVTPKNTEKDGELCPGDRAVTDNILEDKVPRHNVDLVTCLVKEACKRSKREKSNDQHDMNACSAVHTNADHRQDEHLRTGAKGHEKCCLSKVVQNELKNKEDVNNNRTTSPRKSLSHLAVVHCSEKDTTGTKICAKSETGRLRDVHETEMCNENFVQQALIGEDIRLQTSLGSKDETEASNDQVETEGTVKKNNDSSIAILAQRGSLCDTLGQLVNMSGAECKLVSSEVTSPVASSVALGTLMYPDVSNIVEMLVRSGNVQQQSLEQYTELDPEQDRVLEPDNAALEKNARTEVKECTSVEAGEQQDVLDSMQHRELAVPPSEDFGILADCPNHEAGNSMLRDGDSWLSDTAIAEIDQLEMTDLGSCGPSAEIESGVAELGLPQEEEDMQLPLNSEDTKQNVDALDLDTRGTLETQGSNDEDEMTCEIEGFDVMSAVEDITPQEEQRQGEASPKTDEVQVQIRTSTTEEGSVKEEDETMETDLPAQVTTIADMLTGRPLLKDEEPATREVDGEKEQELAVEASSKGFSRGRPRNQPTEEESRDRETCDPETCDEDTVVETCPQGGCPVQSESCEEMDPEIDPELECSVASELGQRRVSERDQPTALDDVEVPHRARDRKPSKPSKDSIKIDRDVAIRCRTRADTLNKDLIELDRDISARSGRRMDRVLRRSSFDSIGMTTRNTTKCQGQLASPARKVPSRLSGSLFPITYSTRRVSGAEKLSSTPSPLPKASLKRKLRGNCSSREGIVTRQQRRGKSKTACCQMCT